MLNWICPDIILRSSHADALLKILKDARESWYFIGEGIDCKQADLREIKSNNNNDKLMCLNSMLRKRLEAGGLTLSKLCESLRGNMVNLGEFADEIEALNLR